MVAENNPRKGHWSLMVLYRDASVCHRVVVGDRVSVVTAVVVAAGVVVRVARRRVVVVVLLLRRLPLTILLVFHPPVLKPDFDLPFG